MKYWNSLPFDSLTSPLNSKDPDYPYFFSVANYFLFDCPKYLSLPVYSQAVLTLYTKASPLNKGLLTYCSLWPHQSLVEPLMMGVDGGEFDSVRFLIEAQSYLCKFDTPSNDPIIQPQNLEHIYGRLNSSFDFGFFILINLVRAGMLCNLPLSKLLAPSAPLSLGVPTRCHETGSDCESFQKNIAYLYQQASFTASLPPLFQYLLYTSFYWNSLFTGSSCKSFSDYYDISCLLYHARYKELVPSSSIFAIRDLLSRTSLINLMPSKGLYSLDSQLISPGRELGSNVPDKNKASGSTNVFVSYGIESSDYEKLTQSFLSLIMPRTGNLEEEDD